MTTIKNIRMSRYDMNFLPCYVSILHISQVLFSKWFQINGLLLKKSYQYLHAATTRQGHAVIVKMIVKI